MNFSAIIFAATLFVSTSAFGAIGIKLDHKGTGSSKICDAGIWHPGANFFNPLNNFEKVSAQRHSVESPAQSKGVQEVAGTSKPKALAKINDQFQNYFDELEFSILSSEYGSHYYVDICTRFPEVEELKSRSPFFNYAVVGETQVAIDAVFSDPADNPYFADAKIEIKPRLICDMTTPKVAKPAFFPIAIDWAGLATSQKGTSDWAEIPEAAVKFDVSPMPVFAPVFPQLDVLPHACVTRIEFIETTKEQRSSYFPLKLNISTRYELMKAN